MNSAPDGYVLNRQPPCPFGRARICPHVPSDQFPTSAVLWTRAFLAERKRQEDYWKRYYQGHWHEHLFGPSMYYDPFTPDFHIRTILNDEQIMALVRPVGTYKLL